jgi:hypothetical protein
MARRHPAAAAAAVRPPLRREVQQPRSSGAPVAPTRRMPGHQPMLHLHAALWPVALPHAATDWSAAVRMAEKSSACGSSAVAVSAEPVQSELVDSEEEDDELNDEDVAEYAVEVLGMKLPQDEGTSARVRRRHHRHRGVWQRASERGGGAHHRTHAVRHGAWGMAQSISGSPPRP